jgi:PST family polysaccharide transporter
MRRYLRHPVVQNALALYWIQFAELALPVVTWPYMARVLEPPGMGLVIFAQSFSGWTGLVMEYGFGFSATREIARNRETPERSAEVAAGVMGASLMLMTLATFVAALVLFTVPKFRAHPIYLWLGVVIAATQGFRPLWYFQGLERMRFPALLNVGGRLLVTVGIFLWVKTTEDGWKVLALQALSGLAISVWIFVEMYKTLPWRPPTWTLSRQALKMGWTVFLSKSAVSLYTQANTFILGLFATTAAVAFYGNAERLNRIVIGLLQPISQALYPRMSHLALKSRSQAEATARLGLLVFGAFGLVMGAACWFIAPLLGILLSEKYLASVGIFRVMSLMVPMIAISSILGVQWMLPFGMDRLFNRIIVAAGVLNICLALYAAPRFGAIGMAWSVVAAETFVTVAMWIALYRNGHRFWSARQNEPPVPEIAG